MVGSRSWFGGLFSRNGNKRQSNGEKTFEYTLSPLQEIRLQKLKERVSVPFDETRPDHQEALVALWHISFPEIELTGLVSEQWKDMGWQGPNPSTDFR
ncbi:hypothetical protein BHE74_00059291 [Ensete ventricosum]|nr:hypothetical protein GW17_00052601 [Ensete ventricosum]RWW35737.1 hypothetical protein BHE74_00059291 [Ensete ventricosum]